MQITAILKARAIAFIEIDELNRNGKLRVADLINPLVAQYNFLNFPQKAEEFDQEKGVKFGSGRSGDVVINEMVVYTGAIYLQTLSSTEDAQKTLIHLLEWGEANVGLTFKPEMIRRWAYISELVFATDFPILADMSKPLDNLAKKTSKITQQIFGVDYVPLAVSLGHDPIKRQHGVANFTISHRVATNIEENRYYSQAPLTTLDHIRLLKELERDVRGESRKKEPRAPKG
jgi:hypothetical protein